ncbi:MAG: hypothetical protein ACLFS3_02430, partial [Candidatus Aenigmatarchaeota archaeon]
MFLASPVEAVSDGTSCTFQYSYYDAGSDSYITETADGTCCSGSCTCPDAEGAACSGSSTDCSSDQICCAESCSSGDDGGDDDRIILPPSTNISSPATGSWHNSDFDVSFSDNKGTYDLDSCQYKIVEDSTVSLSWKERSCSSEVNIDISEYCSVEGENNCTVKSRVIDTEGYTSTTDSRSFSIDTTSPSLEIDFPESGSWHRSDFDISTTDSDSYSGLDNCEYRIDDGNDGSYDTNWQTRTCDGSFGVTVGSLGNCSIEGNNKCKAQIRTTDNAGNNISDERNFSIDYTGPTTSVTPESTDWQSTSIDVEITAQDDENSVSGIEHCWTESSPCTPDDFSSGSSKTVNQSTDGKWTLCHRAEDTLGNLESTSCSSP